MHNAKLIYSRFFRQPLRQVFSVARKKRIVYRRKFIHRYSKIVDKVNRFVWLIWLEWTLLRTYRHPSNRTGLVLRNAQLIEDRKGFEQKVKYLRLMKPFINQETLKKEFYRYTESKVRPLFRNAMGHHSLLDRDYFLSISKNGTLKHYLADFYSSLAGSWSRSMQRPKQSAARKHEGKVRVLFFVKSWGFVDEYLEHLRASDEFLVEVFDFNEYQTSLASLHAKQPSTFEYSFNHLINSFGPFAPTQISVWRTACKLCPSLKKKVYWADVVFVDWMNFPAAWATKYLPKSSNIVVRCHSYEAFTSFPIYINFSKVSSLVFVSEHIKNIFQALHGAAIKNTKIHVIPNLRDIDRFFASDSNSNASSERHWNLGMINYSLQTKGPLFILEVLRHLKNNSERWRLHLAGKSFVENNTVELGAEFAALVRKYKLEDTIVYHGYISDVPEWLSNVGYIVSCSEREGTHESVLEGMAAGCVPILRNWPMVKDFGGPTSVYNGWPVSDTPEEFADQIIASVPQMEVLSAKAMQHAELFKMEVVAPKMDAVIREAVAG